MKKLSYFLLSFSFILFLESCTSNSGGEGKETTPDNTHTLVFIDKTASVDVSKDFVAEKFKNTLNQAIQENINNKGDRFEVYFIHENTSKGQLFNYVCKTKKLLTEGASPTDEQLEKLDYTSKIKKERTKVFKQALNALMNKNTSSSNLETNILASIPIIAKAQKSGASEIRVYYLSDMIESVKNGRDFQKKAPKDEAEAEAWAKEDANKINIENVSLGNVSVKIVLPFDATASSKINNPMVSTYWRILFETLSISAFSEE